MLTPSEIWTLVAVAVLLVFSGLLSLAETSFTGANRARLLSLEQEGNRRAKALNRLLQKRERVIAALLLGYNAINILATALISAVFLAHFDEIGIFYATVVMTLLIVVFAEVMPKTYALASPESSALFFTWLIEGVNYTLDPFARLASAIARGALRIFGVRRQSGSLVEPHEEIRGAVNLLHMEGGVRKSDRNMMEGLLDLKDLIVSDIMIHRTKMNAINVDTPTSELVSIALNSQHTRLPVWRDDPENIIGVLHVKSLVRAFHALDDNESQLDIMQLMTPPWFIPDTTTLGDQLRAFLKRRAHIALVVDEYGEVMGLVTLEDIIEEIVGDIADETDHVIQGVRILSDEVVIANGQVAIRDINRALDWDLPDDEATTLAGLVIHEARMIPDLGQTFTFYGFKFEIIRRERNRITRLKITPTPEARRTQTKLAS